MSAPLTWLWMAWGRDAYNGLFRVLAMPIYGFFGATTVMPEAARDRFINYLPFLILMLLTPRLTLRRRVGGIGLGFGVIFLAHVAFVWAQHEFAGGAASLNVEQFEALFPVLLLSDALPFVLWLVICHEFVRTTLAWAFEASGGAER